MPTSGQVSRYTTRNGVTRCTMISSTLSHTMMRGTSSPITTCSNTKIRNAQSRLRDNAVSGSQETA